MKKTTRTTWCASLDYGEPPPKEQPPIAVQRVVRAHLRKAKNSLLTAVAIIRDAERGDGEVTGRGIRMYLDEAQLAVEAAETVRPNSV